MVPRSLKYCDAAWNTDDDRYAPEGVEGGAQSQGRGVEPVRIRTLSGMLLRQQER